MGAISTKIASSPNKQLARRIFGIYAVLAGLHMAIKLAIFARLYLRFRKATAHLSGSLFSWSGIELAHNFPRFTEFCAETVKPHQREDLIVWQGNMREILFLSPPAVKFMLKDEFAHITKTGDEDELFVLLKEFIGDSIFTLRHGEENPGDHNRWYRQRKAAALIFTKSKFSNMMFGVFEAKARIMLKTLENAAKENAKMKTNDKYKGAVAVDMQEKFFAFTFDSIQKIFFGDDVDTVSGRDRDDAAIAFDGTHRAMMRCIIKQAPLLLLLQILPFPFGALRSDRLWTSPCYQILRLVHPDHREFSFHRNNLHRITREKVQQLRSDPNLADRKDLISNFINHDKSFAAKNGQSESIGWTDEELLAIVLNFIIAGRDTTACTLTWLFYELTVNKDVQEKLQAEIDTLGDRSPTYEEIVNGMPYLNGCLFETLRMHPPVPQDIKLATKDLEYLDGTKIPKGSRLIFHPYSMGRDEERYPDALKFKPERWIPFTEPDPFEFPVFQAAYRSCLGRDMAKFEAKLLTAMLLQKFTFDLEANEDPNVICPTVALTMSLCNSSDQSSHKLWLVPRLREVSN